MANNPLPGINRTHKTPLSNPMTLVKNTGTRLSKNLQELEETLIISFPPQASLDRLTPTAGKGLFLTDALSPRQGTGENQRQVSSKVTQLLRRTEQRTRAPFCLRQLPVLRPQQLTTSTLA